MNAASHSVTRLATRGRANLVSGAGRMLRRWERALIVLAVCLPVPVFAATGLSIPLPPTVERLAAALVPWAGEASFEADESLTLGADGTIVLASHEVAGIQAEAGTALLTDGGATPSQAAAEDRTQPGGKGGTEGTGTPADGDSDGTSSGPVGSEPVGSGSGGGSSGGGSSGGSSDPVGSVIEQTEPATAPVVEAVDETVDDPVGTVGGVVGGILPGAGP
jgi:hypothetical protein